MNLTSFWFAFDSSRRSLTDISRCCELMAVVSSRGCRHHLVKIKRGNARYREFNTVLSKKYTMSGENTRFS